jgi:dihydrolipoamide dehydrogenase
MSENEKRIAVVGAGPGGYAAAFLAADLGMTVTLIDPAPNPGGVCLYVGCIPSKALLHVAKVVEESREAKHWGIEFSEPKIQLDKLRNWKIGVVNKLTGGLGVLAKQRKVEYLQGTAEVVNSQTLRLKGTQGGDQQREFDNIIIATGSRPATLRGLNVESSRIMDSTSALDIPDVPKNLLVVGGGYIGLELGSVYAALGSKVTVVEMTSGLLPGADRDLVRPLEARIQKSFHSILLNTTVAGMEQAKNGIKVRFEGKDVAEPEQVFDKVLVSVGRRPNSEIPGLDATKVTKTERGFIQVNEQLRTQDPHIFAIGDVVGEPMLAHKASHEGRVAVEAIAGHRVAFAPQAIPAVVFTDPEVAWCGLTETQAQAQNRPVRVARFPWGASGRATTLDRNEGITKLIIDPESERVLGMGICGVGAGELISEGVLAVEMGANAKDLALTIHPHPTTSETVMEAAEIVFGTSTHVYRPKK